MASLADGTVDGARAPNRRTAEHLRALDAAILRLEAPGLPLHVGTLYVLDPPADPARRDFAAFVALVAARLPLVPRYRQKVVEAPLGLGTPLWVDDADMDLGHHVRHAALPTPGTIAQLTEYCARLHARPLDRSRPLWELSVIEGLEEGRIALFAKTHHALVDGLDGVDLATVMLDTDADAPAAPGPVEPWVPAPAPSGADLVRATLEGLATSPSQVASLARRLAAAPLGTARRAAGLAVSAARVAGARVVRPAPRSLLNAGPGPHRRLALQRLPLASAKAVKDAFSTTVNDVVLAIVSDAVGRWLRRQGTRTDGLWLRVLVPVSTQEGSDTHRLRSRVVAVFADLPMASMDPVERLRVCQAAMSDVRDTHGAVGAGFLLGLDAFAPPTLHAVAARVAVDARVFNLAITNVPGPQRPTFLNGGRLLGAFPFPSLARGQGLGVGVTSIDGWLNVGLSADFDAVPDVATIADDLVVALDELAACADAVGSRASAAPGASVPLADAGDADVTS
jgi:diacylglycerol O-acyltransferase / wax synthase